MNRVMQKERVTVAGSVVAAIAASSCCIGPLVALVLGVGGAAATSGMQKWRPVFLGVTFVLLGVAWYLTYRKPKADACGGAACAGRRSAKTAKVILWVGTILAVAVAAVPLYAGAVARLVHGKSAAAAPAAGANVASLTVRIPEMDCPACAVNIERALLKVEGIVRAEIVFKTKQVVIAYDPARIAPEKVISAVDETGFKAEPITRLEKQ